MTVRSFDLGDILSVTTGRLVSPRHMDGVHDVLNHMTGDSLFTHQLPRASDECKPFLLAQHPDLGDVDVPEQFDGEAHVLRWLAEQVDRFGDRRDVATVPTDAHVRIDPVAELQAMRPGMPVVVIVAGDES